MLRRLFVTRKDDKNPGDHWACPIHFFDEFQGNDWIDILDIACDIDDTNFDQYDQIIVGGGGLLYNKNFGDILTHIIGNHIKKVWIWGAGVNAPYGRAAYQDKIDQDCDSYDYEINFKRSQTGLRDQQEYFDVLPCVSCMHPVFDEEIEEEYTHLVIPSFKFHDLNVQQFNGYKRINQVNNTIENIVREIKRAKVIITQSYHSAYWAALCGKQPVIFAPWSRKFLYNSFGAPVVSRHNADFKGLEWILDYKKQSKDNAYLLDCRERNQKFYEKVTAND